MAQSKEDAQAKVDKHVWPSECFVWYANAKEGWTPMPGTGCAHWVSHEKGWKGGTLKCDDGYACRVKDIVSKAGKKVEPGEAKKGYFWVSDKQDHCGLVEKVTKPKKAGEAPVIQIRHCSSKQGKVAVNDWAKYFKSGGAFHKA